MTGSSKKRARPPARGKPAETRIGNSILAGLLAGQYRHLLPRLEHVMLKRGQVIYRADQRIDSVYFPDDAVVAMLDRLDDGRTIEVGIIGREGIVGLNIFLGGVATPDRAIVQLAGGAMRMKARDLRKELAFGSPLQRLLLEYARAYLAVISQSVACSQHHNIEQRFARCLLTMNHYARSQAFLLDQGSIASLLGVRRVSISAAARKFQSARLIHYHRARIRVLDEAGLGKRSCECHAFIRTQYRRLQREQRHLLSPLPTSNAPPS